MSNGHPISSYRQTVNRRTGKKGKRACQMKNECLICDGTCAGYEETAERMKPLRERYVRKRNELRQQYERERKLARIEERKR
jgi:hypothetical protein